MHHKSQVSTVIHREVAYIIKRHIEDPRLKNLAVTAVTLSKKLDYATISVTQLDMRFSPEQTVKGLEKAASKIRYCLAKEFSRARRIPKLRFCYDTLMEKNIKLQQLINQSVESL